MVSPYSISPGSWDSPGTQSGIRRVNVARCSVHCTVCKMTEHFPLFLSRQDPGIDAIIGRLGLVGLGGLPMDSALEDFGVILCSASLHLSSYGACPENASSLRDLVPGCMAALQQRGPNTR